jgi:hypothetical protein
MFRFSVLSDESSPVPAGAQRKIFLRAPLMAGHPGFAG